MSTSELSRSLSCHNHGAAGGGHPAILAPWVLYQTPRALFASVSLLVERRARYVHCAWRKYNATCPIPSAPALLSQLLAHLSKPRHSCFPQPCLIGDESTKATGGNASTHNTRLYRRRQQRLGTDAKMILGPKSSLNHNTRRPAAPTGERRLQPPTRP